MISQKQIDEAAILWNKTNNPYYKDLWYRLIKEWYGENTSNTNIAVRWNLGKRAARFHSTDGSARVSDVCRRSQGNNIKVYRNKRLGVK